MRVFKRVLILNAIFWFYDILSFMNLIAPGFILLTFATSYVTASPTTKIYRSIPCFAKMDIKKISARSREAKKYNVILLTKVCPSQISVNATAINNPKPYRKRIQIKLGDAIKLLDNHSVRTYTVIQVGDSHVKFKYNSFWWGVAGSGKRDETVVIRTYSLRIPK